MKINVSKLWSVALIIICYIWSGSVFYTTNPDVVMLRFIAFPLILFSLLKLKKISSSEGLFLSWLLLIMFAVLIRGKGGYFENAALLTAISLGYYVAKRNSCSEVFDAFVKLMIFVASISLLGHFVNNFISPLTWLQQQTNSNDVTYSIGYVYNYITDEPIRNCGPFWEPGVYASWLIITLILLNYSSNIKHKKLCNLVLVLTLLSTVSAAGYMLLLLVGAVFSFRVARAGKSAIAMVVPAIFILGAIALFASGLFANIVSSNEYLNELLRDNLKESSRVFAFAQNWELFLKNPIFGCGQNYVIQNTTNVANTTSTLYLLSSFGILGITYTFAICSGVLKQKRISLIEKILLLLILLIIVNKEGQYDYAFSWILVFLLISNKEALCDKKIEKQAAP